LNSPPTTRGAERAVPILEGNVIDVEPGRFASLLGRLDLILKPGGGIASTNISSFPFSSISAPRTSE
jgi:hypothetical protein